MPQITNLRRLFSSANHYTSPLFVSSPLIPYSLSSNPFLFKPKTPLSLEPRYLFTVLSCSYKGHGNHIRHRPINPSRRNHTSSGSRDKRLPMEENKESVGFNSKRAEGRDGSDKPKRHLQLKVRKLNPVNTICYAQILGTGMDTQDTSPSVLLFFDKQRFIFNAGEGLQRFCTEHKIKLSKIDHIFLSRVCSETAGGLPGLLLTLAGMGEEGMAVNVWGPSDLKYLIDAMKSFIPNAAMVHTRSFGPAPVTGGIVSSIPKMVDNPLVLIEDEIIKISAILLLPCYQNESEITGQHTWTNVDAKRTPLTAPLSQTPDNDTELAVKPGDISVTYVCELPEIKGKFDPKKAVALGLRPGPKFRDLQLGMSVKSDCQNIMVHPSDVLGPSVPGPIILIVDCPTQSHLHQLLRVQSLNSFYADASTVLGENCKIVNCVIHLTPASIVSTTDYQKWMSRFGGAQHIMAGHKLKNIEVPILKASARIAARLNYICPQFFPAPGFWSLENLKCSANSVTIPIKDPTSIFCESISAENLLKFHLRPYAQLGLDRSGVPNSIGISDVISELLSEIPEIKDASEQIKLFWRGGKETGKLLRNISDDKIMIEEPWLDENAVPSCLEDITREDMEIVLLGTGSSQPSKYRNVSSIVINLFSKGSLLLDCGEGTLGQLKRRFGVQGADDILKGLRCIWISHIHADHHTGLARILALRCNLLKGVPHEPLIVIGPRQLKRFLEAYQKLEDLDMQFLDCRHTTQVSMDPFQSLPDHSTLESPTNSQEVVNGNTGGLLEQRTDSTLFSERSRMQSSWKQPGTLTDIAFPFPMLRKLKEVLGEAGLEALISFPVVHCPQAFGVVLQAANRINNAGKTIAGWKIVYSGDTRPCPELIEASRGATVLIHEATFEDGMMEEAVSRNHSTTKEAVEVGDKAGAYRIILTHFSQRYPKIPVFDDKTHMHKTCIAFDMMSINMADLHVLPKVLPFLKLLFRNEMIVDESEDWNVAANIELVS